MRRSAATAAPGGWPRRSAGTEDQTGHQNGYAGNVRRIRRQQGGRPCGVEMVGVLVRDEHGVQVVHVLAKLERELGALLFERSSRTVRLTTAGEALLPHARRVLDASLGLGAAVVPASVAEALSAEPGRRFTVLALEDSRALQPVTVVSRPTETCSHAAQAFLELFSGIGPR